MRTIPIAVLALATSLVLPSAALADDLTDVTPASAKLTIAAPPSLANVHANVDCDAQGGFDPTTSKPTCDGRLVVQWSTSSHYWLGTWRDVGTLDASVPVGTVQGVNAPTPGLESIASRFGDIYLRARWIAPDGSTTDLFGRDEDLLYVGRTIASKEPCGVPARYSYSSRQRPLRLVETLIGQKQYVKKVRETNARTLDKRFWYTTSAPITIRVGGLSYAVSKGSKFAMQCTSVVGVARSKKWPALYLMHGSVRVTGRATAGQRTAGVLTLPGLFSSDTLRSRVDFTVQSNDFDTIRRGANPFRSVVATMRSRVGTLTARQRNKQDPSAHCTPGRGVKMRFDGQTTMLR
jgi:hypothetical protein